MKKLLLAITLLVASATAYANWWSLSGDVQISQQQVTFSALNNTGRAVYCRGYVYGESNYGEVGNFFVDGWVANGAYVTGHVTAWGNRFLVNGWAEINCRF